MNLAACAVLATLATAPRPVLLPQTVVQNLDQHPKVRKASAAIDGARAEVLKRQAPFDLKLAGDAGADPLGIYDQQTLAMKAEQSLPMWGRPKFYGGYRVGNDLPVYEGKRATGILGRFESGLSVDVGRGLFTDEDRTGRQVARIGVRRAEADQRLAQLDLTADALMAYWTWVVAGHQVAISDRLVRLALLRKVQIERSVAAGTVARIVETDNARLVASRRAALQASLLKRTVAAQKLSFYLRDPGGEMIYVDPAAVPFWSWAEAGTDDRWRGHGRLSPEKRPELAALREQEEQVRQQRFLAQEGALPSVELQIKLQQDLGGPAGPGWAIGERQALAGVQVAWPVQRSMARGQLAGADAKLAALRAETRRQTDALQLQIDQFFASLQIETERLGLERDAAKAALALEDAERRRFELGQTDLLAVNLREEATAKELKDFWSTAGRVEVSYALWRLAAGKRPSSPLLALSNDPVEIPGRVKPAAP